MGIKTVSKLTHSSSNNATRLRELVLAELRKSPHAKLPIRIGMELEFFLFNKTRVATLDESAYFLVKLAEAKGWRVYEETPGSTILTRISYDLTGSGYHCVKYEHPPYMMELALAPFSNLNDLARELKAVWVDLEKAALNSGLTIGFKSQIEPQKINWNETRKFGDKFIALAQTREELVDNKDRNEHWVHFTTYTAATQFHIGGIEWWNQADYLVDRLYRVELLAGHHAYKLLGLKDPDIKDAFLNRWDGYFKVFKNLSLLGYPKIKTWNLNTWLSELSHSSIVVTENDPLFGNSISTLPESTSDSEFKRAVLATRDLQIIKPKWIGTLEFRADPALPTAEAIIKQAALRFGLYHFCMSKDFKILKNHSLIDLANRWKSGLDISDFSKELDQAQSGAEQALKARGLQEEKLL